MKRADQALIYGVTGLAVAMGITAAIEPALFLPLLTVHAWCFGYSHVVSTYTRLQQRRFLAYGLPWIVLASVFALSTHVGAGGLNTIYFVFQWFHTTRQSWGLAQHYQRGGRIEEATLWALPVTGMLYRCHQQPVTFLWNDLYLPQVPMEAVVISALAAVALIGRKRPTPYVITHHFVFALAYLAIDDLQAGWLLVNVWHNVQYLLFVWMRNQEQGVLPWLSQRPAVYFVACVAVSIPIFSALYAFTDHLDTYRSTMVSLTLIVAFAINFHHYLVDALIWRRPRALSMPATE